MIFVHGLFGSPDNFETMSSKFEAAGYNSEWLFSFGYQSTGSMKEAADQLTAETTRGLQETDAQQVDIVTHSLGGLPSRWYIRFLGGLDAVDNWISLGGPNNGGTPGTCPAPGSIACDQATQGSEFITKLNNGDPTPDPVMYSTFHSPCDGVVEPEWTILDGTTNTEVGCVTHFDLLSDDQVLAGVLNAVDS